MDGETIFTIRMPNDLIKTLDKVADKHKRSRNNMIIVLLSEAVKKVE